MRIMVVGVRGFPGVEGGVETHAEQLYPLLVRRGCRVECLVRSSYVPGAIGDYWQGVKLTRLWAPYPFASGLEAFIHSFLGVLYAAVKKPDILHIHSLGPAVFSPLARLLGLRVVVTYHTQDYIREKWGCLGRLVLRLGESFASKYSNVCIVISKTLQDRVFSQFRRESVLIPNGVELNNTLSPGNTLAQFDLTPRKYVVLVSRFDPGKRHLDLIRAFAQSGLKGWKLLLVGSLESMDRYVRQVIDQAQKTPDVILAGFQSGRALQEIYSNAGVFVLPSSHEGLPVALLEALSYGMPAIASSIPANLEIGLPPEHYFPVGDISALAERLRLFASREFSDEWRNQLRSRIRENYDWEGVADKTLGAYACAIECAGS